MKAHKVSEKIWRKAKSFKKINGFWNSAQFELKTECGMIEPDLITKSWDATDCKKCLKKKESGE